MPDIDYWKRGTAVIEKKLEQAQEADPANAPFGLVGDEAKLWHQAQASAYQHALEVMGYPTSVKT